MPKTKPSVVLDTKANIKKYAQNKTSVVFNAEANNKTVSLSDANFSGKDITYTHKYVNCATVHSHGSPLLILTLA